jgi:hypothetical protein
MYTNYKLLFIMLLFCVLCFVFCVLCRDWWIGGNLTWCKYVVRAKNLSDSGLTRLDSGLKNWLFFGNHTMVVEVWPILVWPVVRLRRTTKMKIEQGNGPRKQQQTNIKHVLLCISNQLITKILNQCY